MIAIFSTLPGLYFAALLASVDGHVIAIAATPDRLIVRDGATVIRGPLLAPHVLDVESTERNA